MILFPAIDIIDGQAVRLVKGDYNRMTVYEKKALNAALRFQNAGAKYLHLVDLQGAKDGGTPNLATVEEIVKKTHLRVEIGGGIRDEQTVERYLQLGVYRVILGTAAVTDPLFLERMLARYGEKIAVGADLRDGYVSIKGWLEDSALTTFDFFESLQQKGVKTVICTDISRDGLLSGANIALYRQLSERFSMQIVASGGVSSMEDLQKLQQMHLYGAILGKALYTGKLDLAEAIRAFGGDAE